MQQTKTSLQEIKLIGITTVKTSNARLFESDPSTNVVAEAVQRYFHGGLASKIEARKKPGTTFCVYTNYEGDFNGDYTFFIGEEVTSVDKVADGMETLVIPAQQYVKFTNKPGPMPGVCIAMWQNIWKMSDAELGGKRAYIADFEVYDERSADHNHVELDIYIGIKSK